MNNIYIQTFVICWLKFCKIEYLPSILIWFMCTDKNLGDDVEKSAAQFEALENAPTTEKELIKARNPLSGSLLA